MIILAHTTKEIMLNAEDSEIEIRQEPFSSLRLAYIHNGKTKSEQELTVRLFLEEGASLDCFMAMFGGLASKFTLETYLEGTKSSVKQRTIYFGNGNQVFNMTSLTELLAPETCAEIESKGILSDESSAQFDGNIRIAKKAKRSSGRLLEHTLLLSPLARMNAIPGLKIETNDVQASHAASMTRVDDEHLFYCKSRGIEENEAIRLVAEGFLKTVYLDSPWKRKIQPIINEKLCRL